MTTRTTADPLEAARDAFERHAWQEAYDLLTQADAGSPLGPDELEMLGQTAWWCGRNDDCISARERAFAARLDGGENLRAGVIALALVGDHWGRRAEASAQGWFRRAERLLGDAADSAEVGHLWLSRSRYALTRSAYEEAIDAAGRAVELGTRFGDRDLQALALTQQGAAEVARGNVKEGFDLIDEATVAAVGGELSAEVTGVVYCMTIDTCSGLGDYRRAGEWSEAARRWCERQSITGFPGVCRVHHAEILRLRGWWAEAERDARQACTELTDFGLPVLAAEGFNEVGLIRLRMGDNSAAEEAFRQAHEAGSSAHPGMSLLRLAEGKPEAAAKVIRRTLQETKDGLRRARLLPGAVEIALAMGDLDMAGEAATEMERIAEEYGTDSLSAAAACARAQVQLAEGEAEGALRSAREGLRLWQAVEAPYEAVFARVCIGLAYRLQDDEEAASLELGAARGALEKLGAVVDLRRVAGLMATSGQEAMRVARTFMFTDIVRSTDLVAAMGDEAWEDLIGWHDRTLRSLFAQNRGEEVTHAGDGFFVAFEDPRAALDCALAIQRSLAEHRRSHGFAPEVRIGLHASEASQRIGDYGGVGVHAAARIGAAAEGGEILASVETVDAAGSGWEVSGPREIALKGISTPAQVVSVAWRPGQPTP